MQSGQEVFGHIPHRRFSLAAELSSSHSPSHTPRPLRPFRPLLAMNMDVDNDDDEFLADIGVSDLDSECDEGSFICPCFVLRV